MGCRDGLTISRNRPFQITSTEHLKGRPVFLYVEPPWTPEPSEAGETEAVPLAAPSAAAVSEAVPLGAPSARHSASSAHSKGSRGSDSAELGNIFSS